MMKRHEIECGVGQQLTGHPGVALNKNGRVCDKAQRRLPRSSGHRGSQVGVLLPHLAYQNTRKMLGPAKFTSQGTDIPTVQLQLARCPSCRNRLQLPALPCA